MAGTWSAGIPGTGSPLQMLSPIPAIAWQSLDPPLPSGLVAYLSEDARAELVEIERPDFAVSEVVDASGRSSEQEQILEQSGAFRPQHAGGGFRDTRIRPAPSR